MGSFLVKTDDTNRNMRETINLKVTENYKESPVFVRKSMSWKIGQIFCSYQWKIESKSCLESYVLAVMSAYQRQTMQGSAVRDGYGESVVQGTQQHYMVPRQALEKHRRK